VWSVQSIPEACPCLMLDSSDACKEKKEHQAWQASTVLKITKIQNIKFRKLISFISIFEDMKNAQQFSEKNYL
jgi:hypothetical protein